MKHRPVHHEGMLWLAKTFIERDNDEAAERNDIGYLRTKWVKVSTNPLQKVVLDGEIVGTTPIEVECIPAGLTVFAPAEQITQAEEKLEHLSGIEIESKD